MEEDNHRSTVSDLGQLATRRMVSSHGEATHRVAAAMAIHGDCGGSSLQMQVQQLVVVPAAVEVRECGCCSCCSAGLHS